MKKIDTAEVTLINYDPFSSSPAVSFIFKRYAESIDAGLSTQQVPFEPGARVITANYQGQIIGAILWAYTHANRLGWIVFSAVDPEYRRNGIYDLMHPEFEKLIKSLGGLRIGSFVHVNNMVRQKSCAKVGMLPDYYRMHKYLT
jgi:GNAT superfamily N-acetyltransferase